MKNITLSTAELEDLIDNLKSGLYSIDYLADPNNFETQFEYCKHCNRVEYMDHDADCSGMILIRKLQAKLKEAKKKK